MMKITAAPTAQDSSESQWREARGAGARAAPGSAGAVEEVVMVLAP
jgi:hypothetical protein